LLSATKFIGVRWHSAKISCFFERFAEISCFPPLAQSRDLRLATSADALPVVGALLALLASYLVFARI
jgi:hypothetical protein